MKTDCSRLGQYFGKDYQEMIESKVTEYIIPEVEYLQEVGYKPTLISAYPFDLSEVEDEGSNMALAINVHIPLGQFSNMPLTSATQLAKDFGALIVENLELAGIPLRGLEVKGINTDLVLRLILLA